MESYDFEDAATHVHLRRRLADGSTPAWSDILTIIIIIVLLILLLKALLKVSELYQSKMLERVRGALKQRRNMNDSFRSENGYSWDFVMVFKVYDEDDLLTESQRVNSMKRILARVSAGGLESRLFYSVQNDEVYAKIRAPLSRIMKEADRTDYKLLLDADKLRETCLTDTSRPWVPVEIPETNHPQTDLSPYEYIYCRFEFDSDTNDTASHMKGLYKEYNSAVYENAQDAEHPVVARNIFRGVDRLKLIHNIITSNEEGGCGIDTYKLLKEECLLGYFPLHDNVELRALERKWMNFLQFPWNQAVDDVKDYFGEKIGLYFLFLGHYCSWLAPVAVLGVAAWVNVAADGNDPNALLIPYFGAIMALWSTLLLEYWKRKEKHTAMRWGMIGFEEEEEDRPQFEGEKMRSPVTGRPVVYFPREERLWRMAHSSALISGLIIVVIGVIAAIFALRIVMSASKDMTFAGVQLGGIVASILNALQIQIFNQLYGDYAVTLNDYENYRTDTEYEDALIAKTFVFQFVNSFASLFYIAFIKPSMQNIDPCLDSCMAELQTSLGTIFIMQLIVGNLTEVAVPALQMYLNARSNKAGVSTSAVDKKKAADGSGTLNEMSEIEKNYMMVQYDVLLGTFGDYAELALQFGFTTMFVTAFPLCTVMAFVNNYVEIRVDGWKLCQLSRRTEPRSVEDIGTWYTIFDTISILSVYVNAGIICFTSDVAMNETWVVRSWIFVLFSSALLGIKYFIAAIIPDVPEYVEIQMKRQEYFVDKLLYDIMDEDDEDLVKGNRVTANYAVVAKDEDPM